MVVYALVKGRLISKAYCQGRGFSQKTNENTSHTSKNEFIRSFFGRILGQKKTFRDYLTFRSSINFEEAKPYVILIGIPCEFPKNSTVFFKKTWWCHKRICWKKKIELESLENSDWNSKWLLLPKKEKWLAISGNVH